MVYTHSNRHDVIRAIAETYGKACDGFMAASNLTDTAIGTFNLPHDGPEVYQNMWNKVQKMWFYAYSHYLLEFDWFLICGDDTFVIPDNVRTVAAQYEAEAIQNQRKSKGHNAKPTPLYLGASIPHSKNPKRRYCGGGAGYMLNQQAVLLLNRRIHTGECPDAVASDEDIRVARCLDDAGVQCHDTNDEAEEVRFHHLDAQFHASWTPQRSALWLWPKLQYFHGIRGNQSKLQQISNTTTTFHLDRSKVRTRVHDRGIRRYHAILHPELCGSEFAEQVKVASTCNAEQQARLRQAWMVHDSAYK
jgi:glycoprotein-N-acetylgalactosamine 3-beta-galactosyltransferase